MLVLIGDSVRWRLIFLLLMIIAELMIRFGLNTTHSVSQQTHSFIVGVLSNATL